MTRAKFVVTAKTEYVDGWRVELMAVTKTSPENEAFWKYTPSGKVEMTIRKEAGDLFKVGQEYYVDFTPAVVAQSEAAR
jgi:hypothetical protein